MRGERVMPTVQLFRLLLGQNAQNNNVSSAKQMWLCYIYAERFAYLFAASLEDIYPPGICVTMQPQKKDP